MKKITKILAPTDFSEASQKGVERAIDLAAQLGAQLDVLHVIELGTFVYYGQEAFWPKDSTEKINAAARKSMDDLMKKMPEDVAAQTLLESSVGNAADFICEYAKKNSYDLIVMASHGRTGIDRVMLGSIAERVVRKADCPVLTFRG